MLTAAQQGDGRARNVLANAAQDLAVGLGNAVSLLNPERIVLGGRFVAAGDSFLALLRQSLPACGLSELIANVEVRLAERGEDSAFLGIAAHIRNRLLAYPSTGGTVERRPVASPGAAAMTFIVRKLEAPRCGSSGPLRRRYRFLAGASYGVTLSGGDGP